MEITNKHDFPDFVVQWLKNDSYTYHPGVMSATTLMAPPRMYALKKQNKTKLKIDLADLIAMRYGTALHDSIEAVRLTDCVQEKRLYTEINGQKVSGKFDILRETGKLIDGKKEYELIDIKSTSVWGWIFGGKDEEYITQLSIYRYLAIKNGYEVTDQAKIWMIFTDWSGKKARDDEKYPQTRIKIKELELWSIEKTEEYISERIKLLIQAENSKQEDMQPCSDHDLWAKPEKFALMKKTRKSAVKLFNTKQELLDHQEINTEEDLPEGYYIDHRKGKVNRCDYCMCRTFCTQFKELQKEGRV